MSTPFEMRLQAYHAALAQLPKNPEDKAVFDKANQIYEFISGCHPSITKPVVPKLEFSKNTFNTFADFYGIIADYLNRVPFLAVQPYYPWRLNGSNVLVQWVSDQLSNPECNPAYRQLYRQDGNTTTWAILVMYGQYIDRDIIFVGTDSERLEIDTRIKGFANFFNISPDLKATFTTPKPQHKNSIVVDLTGGEAVFNMSGATTLLQFNPPTQTRFHTVYNDGSNVERPDTSRCATPNHFDPKRGYASLIQMTNDIMMDIDALPRHKIVSEWVTVDGYRFRPQKQLLSLIKCMNGICADVHTLCATRQKGMTTALLLKAYQCASLGQKVVFLTSSPAFKEVVFRRLSGLSDMLVDPSLIKCAASDVVFHPSGGEVKFDSIPSFRSGNTYDVVITDNLRYVANEHLAGYETAMRDSIAPHGLVLHGATVEEPFDDVEIVC